MKLSESIQWPDAKTREHAVGSAHYGLRLYEIYRSLMYLDDAEVSGDRVAMRHWLKAYDAAWESYNNLPQQYAELATLYTRTYKQHINNHAESRLETVRAMLSE